MSMKLSRRDKIIFIILIVVAVFIAGGLLLIKPKYEDMQAAQARLEAKEAEKQQLQDKIDTLPGLQQQLKDDVKEVDESQKVFLNEREYNEAHKISPWIKNIVAPEGSELEITSIKLSDSTPQTISEYRAFETNANYQMKFDADIAHQLDDETYWQHENSYPAAMPNVTVGGTVVDINYEIPASDEAWETLYKVIDDIKDNKENIFLNTCSATYKDVAATLEERDAQTATPGAAEEEPKIEGSFKITIYEVYHMDPDDVDKIEVTIE